MKQLNRSVLLGVASGENIQLPDIRQFELPEKILQFGTGVLLRGLPDQYIQEANSRGEFNGRIVVVKSTANGYVNEFEEQDNLYTICTRGIENGILVDRFNINATISRVVNAATHWQQILDFSKSESLQIITSNTTEVGMIYQEESIIDTTPVSFPGRLLQVLHTRYQHFKGDNTRGLVIIPAELIEHNADVLKGVLLKLAAFNSLSTEFIDWMTQCNYFCNTLVDRIVPGKLSDDHQHEIASMLGYTDKLIIMAEPFGLWAIESNEPRVKQILSFCNLDTGCKVVPSIEKFKELKLRLLNASHTFSCGISMLSGITYVRESMQNEVITSYINKLAMEEIVTAIESESIGNEEARDFAQSVLYRFSNPYLDHQWKSISAQFALKMKVRCVPLISKYVDKTNQLPQGMLLGLSAFLVAEGMADKDLQLLLSDQEKWGADLAAIDGLVKLVHQFIVAIQNNELSTILKQYTGVI